MRTLALYDEPLLRQVLARLVRPRNQWPVEELIDRSVATRRPIPPSSTAACRTWSRPAGKLLALIGHSRQPLWKLGSLVEMLMALGHADGLQPLFTLLQAGLLYPRLVAAQLAPQVTGDALQPAASATQDLRAMAGLSRPRRPDRLHPPADRRACRR